MRQPFVNKGECPMLKTIAFMAAICAIAAIPAGAGALPLAQKAGITNSDTVQLVREGCGRGMQWSERRRRCVEDNPGAQIRDMMRGGEVRGGDRRACGRGMRWSDRRGHCVRD
jgi:hypothetical protein